MSHSTREFVKEEVVKLIRYILCHEQLEIRETDNMIKDLGMLSDDFSFMFVPDLEKTLGVESIQREWNEISNVGDVVDLYTNLLEVRSSDVEK